MSDFEPIGRIEPVAPSPSLLSSARNRTGEWGRWLTGVGWTPFGCVSSYNEARCPSGEEGYEREAPETLARVGTEAFTIYTPIACDWVEGEAVARLETDAGSLTAAHAPSAIARALWMGDGLPDDSDQPTLRREAVDVSIGGVAGDLDDVVSVLLSQYEQATDGLGGAVFHVPTPLITGALGGISGGGRVCWPEGNLYRGPLGSVVSPGPGYPHGASAQGLDGHGPLVSGTADAAAGTTNEVYKGNALDECWVYVTGPIEFALGEVRVLPEEEAERRGFHRLNRYEVWGQASALVRFDPCPVFAALAINNAGRVS